jgi:hypothetical protein
MTLLTAYIPFKDKKNFANGNLFKGLKEII